MIKEIVESAVGFDRIDKESRLIRNVNILGRSSVNAYISGTKGTIFTENAHRDLVEKCVGCKVFLDHSSKSEDKDNRGVRKIRDLVGVIESALVDGDRVRGDVRYLKNHAELIEDISTVMPGQVGLSIHAFGPVVIDRDKNMGVVESFTRVESVDIVSAAAGSFGGLFESKRDQEIKNSEDFRMLKIDENEKYQNALRLDQGRQGVSAAERQAMELKETAKKDTAVLPEYSEMVDDRNPGM